MARIYLHHVPAEVLVIRIAFEGSLRMAVRVESLGLAVCVQQERVIVWKQRLAEEFSLFGFWFQRRIRPRPPGRAIADSDPAVADQRRRRAVELPLRINPSRSRFNDIQHDQVSFGQPHELSYPHLAFALRISRGQVRSATSLAIVRLPVEYIRNVQAASLAYGQPIGPGCVVLL